MGVITVSRMSASDGDILAREVADRLGYRLVGRSELARLASFAGDTEAVERSPELRERAPSFWERLNEERRRYGSLLRNAVLQLAEQGDVVVVGLGAGQVLRDVRRVLRVQVVAPMELRIKQVMASGLDDQPGPLTREQARDLLRHADRESAGHIRYLYNIDWLDPMQWDVVINTGRFAIPQAVEALVTMVSWNAATPDPESSRQLHNLALASRIESTLLNQAPVWVSSLRVTAEGGRVRLDGEVMADEDRDAAEQVVRQIEGVESVENDLRIQPPPLTTM